MTRPRVELRDIVTDADRAAALAVEQGPGQDRFVASVEESFRHAIEDARAMPRYWTVNDGDEVVEIGADRGRVNLLHRRGQN